MNKQKLMAVILAVVVVGGAIFLVSTAPQKKPITTTTTPNTNTSATTTASGYSLAQVAAHGDSNSCWAVINGNVYDLSAWISPHPGGSDAILSMCGKDGSVAFNNQHSGSGRVARILETFKIGVLK
ncbi:MAG: cytochrome b5-like heme/steroid binding domain-containing protein [Candidatus Magasanikbacteria bacterium]|nr:cytochrome b5-like heme/steroid binding domain-containing protein [Candidatus Magasanikbacteria bacterium]